MSQALCRPGAFISGVVLNPSVSATSTMLLPSTNGQLSRTGTTQSRAREIRGQLLPVLQEMGPEPRLAMVPSGWVDDQSRWTARELTGRDRLVGAWAELLGA